MIRKMLLPLACVLSVAAAAQIPEELFNDSHDVNSLGAWGPYSKQYAGISHVGELSGGRRVDFAVMPGLYRRSYSVPNVLYESGYHPWRVDPQMTDITYRFDLEWKDRVYVDVTYHVLDSLRVLVGAACVNNTDLPQNILLHNVVWTSYDDDYPRAEAVNTAGTTVRYGCDYASFEPAVRGHDYALVYDGWMRGEARDGRSLSGSVLRDFGRNSGDRVEYRFTAAEACSEGSFALRCKLAEGRRARLKVSGIREGEIELTGTGDYALVRFDCTLEQGGNCIMLESLTAEPVTVDALFFGDAAAVGAVAVRPRPLVYKPALTEGDNGLLVKYDGLQNYYAVGWDYPMTEIKEFANSDLDVFMRRAVHRHPPRYFTGDRNGYYTSVFMRPIVLAPKSDTTIYSLLATGSRQQAEAALDGFRGGGRALAETVAGRSGGGDIPLLPEAADYAFGEQLLEATLLTNVVYPVYTQQGYIRHFTPGKNWNSLYTWDLGFISMALNEIDPVKGFETIRAYTTGEGSQSAFIHHGTPLPIQFFAYSDLNNRLQSDSAAAFLYSRLKRYYDFMVGHNPHSTTRMPSGLLRTWDYFYSSGGWDDYPPQHELRSHTELYPSVAPMVTTSYYLRAAKILRMQARKMGLRRDVAQYDRDIRMLTDAIQRNAWDDEAGYFGYVMHDTAGRPVSLFRYKDGSNFNKGLDGVSPFVAGICTPRQTERILENLFSPDRMWTDIGISTVDRSAPYYSEDGYWNGSVWMPHQYLIWKSLLDNDLTDEAHKVAFTALDTWNRECRASHNSFEHFIVSSGRGAGWHNFSGLSSPLVNWFYSYFRIGHAATGFDAALSRARFSDDCTHYTAEVDFEPAAAGRNVALLLCLTPGPDYEARLDGKAVKTRSPYPGLLYVSLPATARTARLEVKPCKTND